MATQTESTFISENMTDIFKISIANPRFSTTASSQRVPLGDSNNDQQPEMPAKTRYNFISETMTNDVKISNSWIFEHGKLAKCL